MFLHLFNLYFVFETIVHVHSFLDFIRSNFNLCTFYRSVSINQYYYYYYYYIALKYIYLLLRCVGSILYVAADSVAVSGDEPLL